MKIRNEKQNKEKRIKKRKNKENKPRKKIKNENEDIKKRKNKRIEENKKKMRQDNLSLESPEKEMANGKKICNIYLDSRCLSLRSLPLLFFISL